METNKINKSDMSELKTNNNDDCNESTSTVLEFNYSHKDSKQLIPKMPTIVLQNSFL